MLSNLLDFGIVILMTVSSFLALKMGSLIAWSLTRDTLPNMGKRQPRSICNGFNKKGFTADDFLLIVRRFWRMTDLDHFKKVMDIK